MVRHGINTDNQVGSEIFIFDRFGKLLNQLRHNGQGWDGTYNEIQCPQPIILYHQMIMHLRGLHP